MLKFFGEIDMMWMFGVIFRWKLECINIASKIKYQISRPCLLLQLIAFKGIRQFVNDGSPKDSINYKNKSFAPITLWLFSNNLKNNCCCSNEILQWISNSTFVLNVLLRTFILTWFWPTLNVKLAILCPQLQLGFVSKGFRPKTH